MGDMGCDAGPFPRLSSGELHLWRVSLDRPPETDALSSGILSAEERVRAERLVRAVDRQRFIAAHTALRAILGRYLSTAGDRIEIRARNDTKPELAPSPRVPPLRFNLSHSEGLAIVAVTLDREVGVDVEQVRPFEDVRNIVERYFTPGEQTGWLALAANERLPAFFRCWTRKEAYLKARGIGLLLGLDRFEVSLAPDVPARMLWCGDTADAIERWEMYDVAAGEGYAAACVVERGIESVTIRDWPWHSPSTPAEPE